MSKEKAIKLLEGLEKVLGIETEAGKVIAVSEFRKHDLPNFEKKEIKVNGYAACHILKKGEEKFIVPHGLYFTGLEDEEYLDIENIKEWDEHEQLKVYELIHEKTKKIEKISKEVQELTNFFIK